MKKTNGDNPVQRPPGEKIIRLRTASQSVDSSVSITADNYIEALVDQGDGETGSISLQVHLPFCPVRCLSCECNVTVTHGRC